MNKIYFNEIMDKIHINEIDLIDYYQYLVFQKIKPKKDKLKQLKLR